MTFIGLTMIIACWLLLSIWLLIGFVFYIHNDGELPKCFNKILVIIFCIGFAGVGILSIESIVALFTTFF